MSLFDSAKKREFPRQEQTWEIRLERADDNVREIVPLLINQIVELDDVKHAPNYVWYQFFRNQFEYNSKFCALSLKKDKVIVSIRVNPETFRDPKNWTGTRVYQWFFHYRPGEERKFAIESKGQIPYAMELIRQSYELTSEGH